MQSIVGNMGEPLAHGFEEESEDDEAAAEVSNHPDAEVRGEDSGVGQSDASQQEEVDDIYAVRG